MGLSLLAQIAATYTQGKFATGAFSPWLRTKRTTRGIHIHRRVRFVRSASKIEQPHAVLNATAPFLLLGIIRSRGEGMAYMIFISSPWSMIKRFGD